MGKRGEQLQAEHSGADLQDRAVRQRRVRPGAPAGYRHAVHQHFAADPGTDQQAGAVLPIHSVVIRKGKIIRFSRPLLKQNI